MRHALASRPRSYPSSEQLFSENQEMKGFVAPGWHPSSLVPHSRSHPAIASPGRPRYGLPMPAPHAAKSAARKRNSFVAFIRSEYPLYQLYSGHLLHHRQSARGKPLQSRTAAVFIWLFSTVLWSAISVVRHADCLAIKCGEPLWNTDPDFAVISIEVMMIPPRCCMAPIILPSPGI